MDLIFLGCGVGTLILLVAQMLDYLRQAPQPPIAIRTLPLTAGQTLPSHVDATVDPARQYDQAA